MKAINKKIITLFLVALSIMIAFPINAFAHDAYFLQFLVNESDNLLDSAVVKDNASTTNNESKHIEAQYFSKKFEDIIKSSSSEIMGKDMNSISYLGVVPKGGQTQLGLGEMLNASDHMLLTFPSKEDKVSTTKNDGTTRDAQRASFVGTTLTSSINEAIVFVNGGKKPASEAELFTILNNISSGASRSFTTNGASVSIGPIGLTGSELQKFESGLKNFDPDGGEVSANDFVQIKRNGVTRYFIFRLDKGYKNGLITETASHYSGDLEKISWLHASSQAKVFKAYYGFTNLKNTEIRELGTVETAMVDMASGFFADVNDFLGLYTMSELVYNSGVRSTSSWWYGTMSNEWRDRGALFFYVFLGLGYSLIILSFIINLAKKNMSSINPVIRTDMMETFQNLIITALLLGALLPFISMILRLNVKLVDLFGAFVDFENMNIKGYNSGLGGVFVEAVYFVLTIIFNFTYIIRSISIAILFAMAPLFVASITFGGKKAMFGNWIRELLSNIFKQSFDAFFIGFFLSLTMGTRGIETLIVLFSCIPLSRFVMSLISGGAGTLSSQLGLGAFGLSAGVAGGMMAKTSETFRGGKGNHSSGGQSTSGEKADSSSKESGSPTMSNPSTKDSSAMTGSSNSGFSVSENGVGGKESALSSTNQYASTGDTVNSSRSMSNAEVRKSELGTSNPGATMRTGSLSGQSGNNIGEKAQKVGLGAMKAGFGVGQMLMSGASIVAGGSDGGVAQAGLKGFVGGFGDMTNGGGSMLGGVTGMKGNTPLSMDELNKKTEQFYDGTQFDSETGSHFTSLGNGEKEYAFLDSQIGESKLQNGNVQVDHHAGAFSKNTGITSANMDGDDMILEYDLAMMKNSDAENLRNLSSFGDAIKEAPRDEAQGMTKSLHAQGISDFSKIDSNNKMQVRYNKEARENLGAQKLFNQNGKMVEIKSPMNPRPFTPTYKVDFNASAPQQSSQGKGSGGKTN